MIHILHLEDSTPDAELVSARLESAGIDCTIQVVDTWKAFAAAAHGGGIDLILADYNLQGFDGMKALLFARKHLPAAPFIFVSGSIGEERAVQALRMGATDYVMKDHSERLPEAVRRALKEAEALTEQLSTQAALRETNELLTAVIQSSPSPIVVLDTNGVLTLWNAAAERVFGWKADEVIGRPLPTIPDDKHEEHRSFRERVLQGEHLTDLETVRRRKDGSSVPISLSVAALRKPGGRPYGLLGIMVDISERKRAEQRSKWFRTLLDYVTDSIEVIDPGTGRFLDGNEKAWSNLGYTRGELLSLTVPDIDPLVTGPALAQIVEQQRQTGKALCIETVHRRKDGTTFPVEVSAQLIRQDDSEFLVAIVRDITERKRAEEALKASQEQYKLLVDHANDMIYRTDSHGRFTFVNPTAAGITQYSAPELLGLRFSNLVSPEYSLTVEKFYDRTAAGKTTNTYHEVPVIRKDGTEIWLGQNVQPLFVGDQVIGFQGIARDITAQRLLEEARLAEAALERASQSKSQFLSRMSHELRTPLNSILGFAQLLEIEGLLPKQSQHAAQIIKGGKHLLELINEVLDISRIEAGRMQLSLEPVAVHEAVREAVDLIRPLTAEQNLTMEVCLEETERLYVRADRARLGQVLLNLLGNAVKYNRSKGMVVVSAGTQPHGRVRLTIRDTGYGIPLDKLPRLFTPFDRLGAEASGIEGTGLGLSLAKHLVEAMGGCIGVDSVRGTGSSFWVDFDQAEAPVERALRSAQDDVPAAALKTLVGQTVLYVEDNLANLVLVERILEQRPGLRLLSAMQGQIGLDLAREHHPNLILLDVHLPDLSGDEVLHRLKADPDTQGIPVVVLSADAMPQNIKHLREAGACSYLTKPLDVKQFLSFLDETLGRSSSGGEQAKEGLHGA